MILKDQLNPLQALFWPLYKIRRTSFAIRSFTWFGKRRPVLKPVFILGVNRSGTSMFVRLVRETRDLLDWSEANDLWDPVGYPWPEARVERSFWPFDPQGYTDQLTEQNGDRYINSIPGIISAYLFSAPLRRGVRFLNKSPMNSLRVKQLSRLFPDAMYVVILRHPVAVINSWLKKIEPALEKHPRCSFVPAIDGAAGSYIVLGETYSRREVIEIMADSYQYIYNSMLGDLQQGSHASMILKYEDLGDDLHGVLATVDQFLGLDEGSRHWHRIPERAEIRNDKAFRNLSDIEQALVAVRCKGIIDVHYP